MTKTKNKSFLSWSDIEVLVNELCNNIIKSKIEIKDIFGLQRGGLIPAVMISHKLNLPMTKGTITPTTLIIDDICDSGVTFNDFYQKHQVEYAFPFNLKTVCLHFKPNTSQFLPTTWAKTITTDDWIVYPWERDDSESIQDYKL